ncbi:hypothetical protein AU197_21175 [Mycobacterium sp. IS-1590]|uniref:hypothetical protein n=1 Tax=Mycobacterium sp. IS-1590 TaxID=1772286 RepID=UPI00074B1B43|nr:hypothetical protein [Mycobacterium sp. IS-1590]KUI43919.1 hypothetical protein AU197_21175 [Mycobacterium sp. IS-1590]
MTNEPVITVADARRAALLICHYSQGSAEGCNAVLKDAADANRVTNFILAICDVYAAIVPLLHSELGVTAIQGCIAKMAMREDAQ